LCATTANLVVAVECARVPARIQYTWYDLDLTWHNSKTRTDSNSCTTPFLHGPSRRLAVVVVNVDVDSRHTGTSIEFKSAERRVCSIPRAMQANGGFLVAKLIPSVWRVSSQQQTKSGSQLMVTLPTLSDATADYHVV
jgi:hypothetical protein